MKELSRNRIPDLFCVKKVNVPEWDGYVYLRKWSGKERFSVLKEIKKIGSIEDIMNQDDEGIDYEELQNVMLTIVCKSLSDSQGIRLYADNEISELDKKDPDVIQYLFAESMRVNGLGEKSVEESAKNSGTSQNG